MAAYYGDLNDLLRRARQKYSYGQNIPPSSLNAMTAGAIEAAGARTLNYAQLAQQQNALNAELSLQKRAQKAESMGGYLQLGTTVAQLGLGTEGGRKLLGLDKTTAVATKTTGTSPYSGSAVSHGERLATGAAPVNYTAGTGAAPVNYTAGTGGLIRQGASRMGAEKSAEMAGAGVTSETATSLSAYTGGIGAGFTGGTIGGWAGQRLTRAGEQGHKGGERITGRFIGGVTGAVLGAGLASWAAGAAFGSIIPGAGTIIGAIIGGLYGMFTGGGGKK